MTEIRKPGASDARLPLGGPKPPARPDVAAPTPTAPAEVARDAAALSAGAGEVKTGGKRPLGAYTPDVEDAEPAGPVFDSRGLVRPSEPGPRVAALAAEGDFEVQVEWVAGADGLVAGGVGVRANAAGDFVTVDGQGQVRVGGEPAATTPERPHALPNGGTVTDWGDGYAVIETPAGDSVSVFARGTHVDFMGRLAADRLPVALPGE